MSFNTYPPNGWPPSTEDMEAGDITAEEKALIQQVPGKAGKTDIAPEFSTDAAYYAGDIVYHNGTLYEFTADHAAGAWSTGDTQAATVGGKITSLEGDVDNLSDVKANQITIAPTFSEETAYDPGDLVYHGGLTYRCVNAHEGEWDADDFAATTISNELSSLESGLTNVNNRLVTVSLSYDDQDEIYPVPVDKKPVDDAPITCTARNRQTGALYLLWYNGGAGGFKVGHVISGSAPTAAQTAVVQYFT